MLVCVIEVSMFRPHFKMHVYKYMNYSIALSKLLILNIANISSLKIIIALNLFNILNDNK